jgi:hypothetical protein
MIDEPLEPVGPPPEESQNRMFVLLALGLGGLFILGLILIALFAFVIAPGQRRARSAAATGTAAGNIALAQALTATQLAVLGGGDKTEAPPATAVSAAATNTPLIAASATNTLPPSNTAAPSATKPSATPGLAGVGTGTPQALKTRTPTPSLVGTVRTATPTRRPTATALPTTGFADDVGVPGLLMLGAGLVAVLFIARRLRLGRA